MPVEDYIDPATRNYWRDVLTACDSGTGKYNKAEALKGLQKSARDHSRTPFQWDDGVNAGFTTNEQPWCEAFGLSFACD